MLLLEKLEQSKENQKDHSSININIAHDTGVIMNIIICRDRVQGSLVYNAHVSFLANKSELKIDELNINVLSELVRKYRSYTRDVSKVNQILPSDFTVLSQTLADIKKVEDLPSFIRDFTKLDVFTIDKFTNKAIARTTIELDADIFTVIPQQVLGDSRLGIMLDLQNCNFYLANQLFKSHIKVFTDILLLSNRMIKSASIVPFVLSLIPFFSSLSNVSHAQFSFTAFFAIVTPFLYRYVPSIIFRYMPSILLRVAPGIIEYLKN